MHLLFSLWHLQVWSKLQVWPPYGNLHIQSLCIVFNWYPSPALVGAIIRDFCVKFIIRRTCWSRTKAQETIAVRDQTDIFWGWEYWDRGLKPASGNEPFTFYNLLGDKQELCVNSFPIAGDVQNSCQVDSVLLKIHFSRETQLFWFS